MGLVGIAYAFFAALAFGVQYVPVKKYEIYDGTTFQWFMCSGILFVGFLIALATGTLASGCSYLIILGGILWSLSNYAVLPLVKLLGIGLGFSLYHFVNLIVGYSVGRFGLFGVPQLQGCVGLCDVGCCCILVSFLVMIFVETEPHKTQEAGQTMSPLPPLLFDGLDLEYRESYHRWRLGEAQGSKDPKVTADFEDHSNYRSSGGFATFARPRRGSPSSGFLQRFLSQAQGRAGAEPLLATTASAAASAAASGRSAALKRKATGVLLALVGGGLCGVQTVPATLHSAKHPHESPLAVVFSQSLGIWVGSSAIYWLYASLAKRVPHSAIRPAYISGCIWLIGFAFMVCGIHEIGYSVGYTLDAVGPIVISSLISLFYYREIAGRRQLVLYSCGFCLQMVGVVLIAMFGRPS
eukprot:TRINITY_DN21073_c0_g1_i1.p1 TRINITY_DN21073_c0_g1~~TRINITY_DN21073_c0_g1_i1.p1  ORF type:complete len:477 (+),score=62.63 TRINITY_DN21073_c0_g1_i1:203-1432(+)